MEKPEAIQKRIRNISETRKITKAMEMIASAKLKTARSRIIEARDFISGVEDVIIDIACYTKFTSNPLLQAPIKDETVLILGITSDKGLCGSYNSDIMKLIEKTIYKFSQFKKTVSLDIIGTRGKNYFQYIDYPIKMVYENLSDHPQFLDAREISKDLVSRYLLGEADRVLICYTEFINSLEFVPVIRQLLPISMNIKFNYTNADTLITSIIDDRKSNTQENGEIGVEVVLDGKVCRIFPQFIYDPALDDVLDALLPEYIDTIVYGALLDSTASETQSRKNAMEKASVNAENMVKNLMLLYHKSRQQNITTELAEIISAAEAISAKH